MTKVPFFQIMNYIYDGHVDDRFVYDNSLQKLLESKLDSNKLYATLEKKFNDRANEILQDTLQTKLGLYHIELVELGDGNNQSDFYIPTIFKIFEGILVKVRPVNTIWSYTFKYEDNPIDKIHHDHLLDIDSLDLDAINDFYISHLLEHPEYLFEPTKEDISFEVVSEERLNSLPPAFFKDLYKTFDHDIEIKINDDIITLEDVINRYNRS